LTESDRDEQPSANEQVSDARFDFDDVNEELETGRLLTTDVGGRAIMNMDVDILEAQFRVDPKPNSEIKRQLAIQTNLSLSQLWYAVSLLPLTSVSMSAKEEIRTHKLTLICRFGSSIGRQNPSNRQDKSKSNACKGWQRRI
jgi:hypothetical protein